MNDCMWVTSKIQQLFRFLYQGVVTSINTSCMCLWQPTDMVYTTITTAITTITSIITTIFREYLPLVEVVRAQKAVPVVGWQLKLRPNGKHALVEIC